MTREYRKRDDIEAVHKYCACGCGRELSLQQIKEGGTCANRACAARLMHRKKEAKANEVACRCGCGEPVPEANRKQQYWFVNEKHEMLFVKQEIRRQREREEFLANPKRKWYCKNYKDGYVTCALCEGSIDGTYRGCYEKPERSY